MLTTIHSCGKGAALKTILHLWAFFRSVVYKGYAGNIATLEQT